MKELFEILKNPNDKLIAVDLDGTLCEGEFWGKEDVEPIKERIDYFNSLYMKGAHIIIYTARQPKWLPETPASEEGELEKRSEKQAELKPEERLTASEEYLEGNVRKLVSLIESRFESADKFDNLKLEFEFSDKIEKEELMKFIKKLPDADKILATLRVWKK